MNKDELRELLHQEYKTENWKKVTEFVFPNVQYLQRPQPIPFSNDKVESFKQIGNVKLTDGKNLAMFEVKVAQNVNLARNRVELRKLVENLIDKERNHGVLVIYEQGKEDYRFTFTAKSTEFDDEENDFVDLETDAKRFTYILGKNESCKTAANRFWELSTHKDTATIKDVENAFSVERLNKEFFNKYKEFYEDFVQYITGKRFVKERGKWVEKKIGRAKPIHKEVFDSDDKLARNFVKLLLGRLVFIQFLQKKGWMGVPATSKQWKNGDPDFLLNMFNNFKSKDEFYSKCLYPLFYKAFNTPDRPNDVFGLIGSRVPYLNGGLFENENPKTIQIDFKPVLFAGLLDFFGQYNFTIDENDPLDHEVGIDPEMLGHIFENLLEDNKDKGAFYTPKPIVQYMCQESLIQYLKTYLQEHQVWPEEEDAASQTETNLQNFVRKKIAGELLNDYEEHLARALKEVKICDPAIGSGAFPMGLLNEIFQCVQLLYGPGNQSTKEVWEMEEWAPDIVKKNIIQHSIYGVDIEKGAVDIARLRFWLSLIVDEQEPTPLPNLDFKIMQGNSLLESYEGIDLSKIVGTKKVVKEVEKDLFGNPINIQSSIFDTKITDNNKITGLIDNYFNTQEPEQKQRLKKGIDLIVHNVLDECIKDGENDILFKITNIKDGLSYLKIDKNHSTAIAAKTKKAKEKLTKELEKEQEQLEHLKVTRKELHNLQKTAERPYFLWQLFFKDVFEKGGFDIVIGNPPYKIIFDVGLKEQLTCLYPSFKRNNDIYVSFFEKGVNITKKNGSISYITPNTYRNGDYFDNLRKFLASNTTINEIVDYKNFPVFNEPTVFVSVFLAYKNAANKYPYNYILKECQGKSIYDLKKLVCKITSEVSKPFVFTDEIITKLELTTDMVSIDDLFYVKDVGFNYWSEGGEKNRDGNSIGKRVFYQGEQKNKKDISFLKGKNINPFKIGVPDNYLINNYRQKLNPNDTFRFSQEFLETIPKLIYRQTANEPIAAIDKTGHYIDKTVHLIIPRINNENISLKYLCGLLNSSLYKYLYTYISQEEKGRAFSQVKATYIKKLPYPVKMPFKKQIEDIVDILEVAESDSSRFLKKYRELNILIFKIFNLTFNDVNYIGNSFDISETELT